MYFVHEAEFIRWRVTASTDTDIRRKDYAYQYSRVYIGTNSNTPTMTLALRSLTFAQVESLEIDVLPTRH
jgi:hypothetical protein